MSRENMNWLLCAIFLASIATQLNFVQGYTAYSECDPYADGLCVPGHPNAYKGNLRVAVAQVASNSTDTLEENAKKHADWIDMAGKEGARAILFPELSMSKFFLFLFFFTGSL